jgi:AcrR family transcriptional regulator
MPSPLGRAAAADVQPPTIYRQIGDKEDLLDAVAHYVLQEYTATKRQVAIASDDPVQDLRELWDLHRRIRLSNPAAYAPPTGTEGGQGRCRSCRNRRDPARGDHDSDQGSA